MARQPKKPRGPKLYGVKVQVVGYGMAAFGFEAKSWYEAKKIAKRKFRGLHPGSIDVAESDWTLEKEYERDVE